MKFNIYYLNLSKAYEISMMIDNTITTKIEREKTHSREKNRGGNAEVSLSLPWKNKAALKTNLAGKDINSDILREIIEVKTTKSLYLSKVIEKSKQVNAIEELKEGDLVKLNKSKLSLHNEEEIRQLKILNNGLLKGVTVDEYDVNNLIDSVLKDYAYLLRGQVEDKEIVLKIPMNVDNEFENEYNIDDILIGDVSIVGIYKGEVGLESIKNTFNYLTNQATEQQDTEEEEFIPSDQSQIPTEQADTAEEGRKLYFIDIIAIVQEINFNEEVQVVQEEGRIKKWIQRMQFWK
ncbi:MULTISPECIES: hypothetical protein [Bacillus]|uniref:Uncharacterized protein n=1 Tax=Bacillus cereus TaxID=1396 RepID=A0A164PBS4_BACCE|nr:MULTISPECIES: hypothetical protein [Bacillus]KZD66764.1 hypothetical protein B4088_1975 [Bacillus cereus]TSI22016.1 hypothetical protein FOT98_05485 [Bacillus sp. HY001]